VGLLTGKKAYVFATRGGLYGDDHSQSEFVRQFLGFIGITDVEFVYAEGLAISPESRNNSLSAAQAQSLRLAAQTRLAA
jgi:FMN-dependent NADH-azoreductase